MCFPGVVCVPSELCGVYFTWWTLKITGSFFPPLQRSVCWSAVWRARLGCWQRQILWLLQVPLQQTGKKQSLMFLLTGVCQYKNFYSLIAKAFLYFLTICISIWEAGLSANEMSLVVNWFMGYQWCSLNLCRKIRCFRRPRPYSALFHSILWLLYLINLH